MPRAALEQHQRRRDARELGDARAPLALLRRQEAFEEEPVGRQARDRQRRQRRRSARQRGDRMAGLARRAHQLEAGVGDQRRAGIRYQRDGPPGGEPREQLRPRRGGGPRGRIGATAVLFGRGGDAERTVDAVATLTEAALGR